MITSERNPKLMHARRLLREAKYRRTHLEYGVEGVKRVEELLERHPEAVRYVLVRESEFIAWGGRGLSPVYGVKDSVLHALDTVPSSQGILAVVAQPQWEWEAVARQATCLAVLYGVSDPRNVGAIVRNAAAFGVDAVVLVRAADPFHPESVRASAGCVHEMPSLTGFPALFEALQAGGFEALMLDSREGMALTAAVLPDKPMFVFGSEGKGIEDFSIWQGPKRNVYVPIAERVDSLNVAVTSGVVFFKWNTQSLSMKCNWGF